MKPVKPSSINIAMAVTSITDRLLLGSEQFSLQLTNTKHKYNQRFVKRRSTTCPGGALTELQQEGLVSLTCTARRV